MFVTDSSRSSKDASVPGHACCRCLSLLLDEQYLIVRCRQVLPRIILQKVLEFTDVLRNSRKLSRDGLIDQLCGPKRLDKRSEPHWARTCVLGLEYVKDVCLAFHDWCPLLNALQ